MIIAAKCVQMLQQPTAVTMCLSQSRPLKTGRAALNLCGLLFSTREREKIKDRATASLEPRGQA